MIDHIGGRKVFSAMVIMILGVGAVLLRGDIPPGMLSLLQTVFGAFVVGNVFEHGAAAVKSRAPTTDLTHVVAKLEELKVGIGQVGAGIGSTQEGVAMVQQTLLEIIRQSAPPKR